MAETYVINASPLILLGKIRQLSLLPLLGSELILPKAVLSEVAAGCGGSEIIRQLLESKKFHIAPDLQVPHSVSRWDLGDGESQVLTSAILKPATVVLDDLAARKCARAHGLSTIGTAGLIGLLKKRGHIPLAEPLLTALVRAGLRLSPQVFEAVLREVDEATDIPEQEQSAL